MIEQLHKIAKERGGRCLSDDCANPHSIVWWECEQGHRWQASPIRVKLAKNWCPGCAGRSPRKTIKDMQDVAAERGGQCLSETYKDARSKLLWECSQRHQWEAVPGGILLGSWCPTCAGNAKPTIEDMQDVAADRDGNCLSDVYVNSQTKLTWECNEGHQWETTPNKIKSGSWCPKCHNKTRGDFRRLSIEEMVQIAKDRGGRCLSETYTNTRTKLKWECSEGHIWEAVPNSIKKGTWCPECYVSPLTRRKQERSE